MNSTSPNAPEGPVAAPPEASPEAPPRFLFSLMFVVWLAVVLVTTLVTFVLPETFASVARIKVERDVTDIEGMAGSRMNLGYDPYFIQTEFEAIQSEVILGKVIDLLELNKVWGDKYQGGTPLKTTDTIGVLKGKMALRPVRGTSLIEITVYSEDRNEAARIANAVAETYKAFRLEERRKLASGGIDKLEEKYSEQQNKIRTAQKELEDLRDGLKISDTEASGSGPMQLLESDRLRRLTAKKIEQEASLISRQASVRSLKALSKDELRRVLPRFQQDQRLTELLTQLSLAEQTMLSFEKGPSPDASNRKRLQEQLEKLRKEVNENIEGIMALLDVTLTIGQAEVDGLKKSVEDAQQQDIDKAQKSRPYFDKKREVEELIFFAKVLNSKLAAEKIDLALPKTTMVEIMDRAQPSTKPARPNKPLNILLGIFVGGITGLLLAALVYLLERRAFRRRSGAGSPTVPRRFRTILHVTIALVVGVIVGRTCAMPMSIGSLFFMQLSLVIGGVASAFIELANPRDSFKTPP